MIKVDWIDGECNECGDPVKTVYGHEETCKACKHIQALIRIAYVLEQRLGWD